jgi:hypothetical protein
MMRMMVLTMVVESRSSHPEGVAGLKRDGYIFLRGRRLRPRAGRLMSEDADLIPRREVLQARTSIAHVLHESFGDLLGEPIEDDSSYEEKLVPLPLNLPTSRHLSKGIVLTGFGSISALPEVGEEPQGFAR